ncbi:ATP-dependent DNA ligase [Collibacillus ludicampi]|uniref:ATP-dependent DNA ligase n=1 Tax=Collibacillus ludicampi TaxID=2771369 RepID=A0AAV4LA06_9BACL|nr:RNA ligase family protein [Collibacillus ludicampi]GIM44494.1 ATP-dependent DNA ligase [Collibacillus ludicampi]
MLFQPIKPMLASMQKTFDLRNPEYIYELKADGWRCLLHKQGRKIEVFTRHGNRITEKFPEFQAAADAIQVTEAIIDCEGVCYRDRRTIFDDFNTRGRLSDPAKITEASRRMPATLIAFDVLYTDGKEHINQDLVTRKQILQEIIEPNDVITPTLFVDELGDWLLEWSKQNHWEGIVAKHKRSKYALDTRSSDWIKIKNFRSIDVVILGYRLKPRFGLLVGLHFPTVSYKPVATVELGFNQVEKQAFLEVAKQIHTYRDRRGVQWVEPLLCCEIQYLDRTEKHNLRITSFKRFLPHKNPEECKWVS